MTKRKKIKIEERVATSIAAWRALSPESSFSGLTLAQAEAALAPPMEIRERILALEKEIEGLKMQRIDEDAAASKLLDAIVSSIKGDLNHGKNSALYRGCGYIRQSEVKSRARKATPVVSVSPEIIPSTPPIETGGADGSANSNAA
jgi:uncharacterized small protein (DUF1192 family)